MSILSLEEMLKRARQEAQARVTAIASQQAQARVVAPAGPPQPSFFTAIGEMQSRITALAKAQEVARRVATAAVPVAQKKGIFGFTMPELPEVYQPRVVGAEEPSAVMAPEVLEPTVPKLVTSDEELDKLLQSKGYASLATYKDVLRYPQTDIERWTTGWFNPLPKKADAERQAQVFLDRQNPQKIAEADALVAPTLAKFGLPDPATIRSYNINGLEPETAAKHPTYAKILLGTQGKVQQWEHNTIAGKFEARIGARGVSVSTMQAATEAPTTGNKVLDFMADLVGTAMGYAVPGMPGKAAIRLGAVAGGTIAPQLARLLPEKLVMPVTHAVTAAAGGAAAGAGREAAEAKGLGDIARAAGQEALLWALSDAIVGNAIRWVEPKIARALGDVQLRLEGRREIGGPYGDHTRIWWREVEVPKVETPGAKIVREAMGLPAAETHYEFVAEALTPENALARVNYFNRFSETAVGFQPAPQDFLDMVMPSGEAGQAVVGMGLLGQKPLPQYITLDWVDPELRPLIHQLQGWLWGATAGPGPERLSETALAIYNQIAEGRMLGPAESEAAVRLAEWVTGDVKISTPEGMVPVGWEPAKEGAVFQHKAKLVPEAEFAATRGRGPEAVAAAATEFLAAHERGLEAERAETGEAVKAGRMPAAPAPEVAAPEVVTPEVAVPAPVEFKVPTTGLRAAFHVGQVVFHPTTGDALTIVDASDPADLRVKNARGTELHIGKGAVNLEAPPVNVPAPTPVKVVTAAAGAPIRKEYWVAIAPPGKKIVHQSDLTQVSGKPVKATTKGFEDLDLFIHRTLAWSTVEGKFVPGKDWTVSEGRTGFKIGSGETQNRALANLDARLARVKTREKFEDVVNRHLQETPLSPRYSQVGEGAPVQEAPQVVTGPQAVEVPTTRPAQPISAPAVAPTPREEQITAAAVPGQAVAPKESWEMTTEEAVTQGLAQDQEYQNVLRSKSEYTGMVRERVIQRATDQHGADVMLALVRGEDVPANVVEDYVEHGGEMPPALAAKYGRPPPATPAAETAVKEPWEMTFAEVYGILTDQNSPAAVRKPLLEDLYREEVGRFGLEISPDITKLSQRHRRSITEAAQAGQTIPAEVLAEYPDLAGKVARPAERKPTAEPKKVEPAPEFKVGQRVVVTKDNKQMMGTIRGLTYSIFFRRMEPEITLDGGTRLTPPYSFDIAEDQTPAAGAPALASAPEVTVEPLEAELGRLIRSRTRTGPQEKRIAWLQKAIAADPSKWHVGDGVGWHPTPTQVNRGYRIIKTFPETKEVIIRSVAETGLTITGGADVMPDERVHIVDLVRDRKYDATFAEIVAATKGKAPARAPEPVRRGVVTQNKTLDGVEIHFPQKPGEEVLTRLREAGFTWNGKRRVWYIKGITEERLAKARGIAAGTPAEVEPAAPPEREPEAAKVVTHAAEVAEWVTDKLKARSTITAEDLFAETARVSGGTAAEGKFTPKDAYDYMELGVNKWLEKAAVGAMIGQSAKAAADTVLDLEDRILSKIPTQTRRTGESDQFQQFSTPPNIAYVAAWTANIMPDDVVLEPSAGIGGLAVFAKAAGAKEIIVNELSLRRAGILAEMGFDRLFHENAEQIDNILPKDVKPTVVLMNPPFSAAPSRMATATRTEFAEAHIEQGLKRLEPNGRLVTIVGQGMADDAPQFRKWWEKIRKSYNVRANIGLERETYRKYGTNWPVQIVVIDKTGSTAKGTVTGKNLSLEEALKVLEAIKNDRVRPAKPSAGEPVGETAVAEGRGGPRPEPAVPPAARGVGVPARETAPALAGLQGPWAGLQGTVRGAPGPEGGVGLEPSPERGPGRGQPAGEVAPTEGIPEAEVAAGRGAVRPEPTRGGVGQPGGAAEAEIKPTAPVIAVESRAQTQFGEEVGSGDTSSPIYSRYVPQRLKIPGAKEHPTALAESAAMAAVVPIEPTYTPDLPRRLITSGDLSIAQLEAIVYAGQAHEQELPSGERRGYFLGDGNGVGKGRIVSAIILDNMNRGRKKAVWISKNMKLMRDALRDWTDIGGDPQTIFPLSKINRDAQIKQPEGILFTTYSTLAQGLTEVKGEGQRTEGKAARLDQIVEWLGKDFDGALILDESHMMQNCIAVKGVRGLEAPSARALAGIELQRLLPKARIVYSSATGATEPANLGYEHRLGLWGEGTPFPDPRNFVGEISAGGLAAMELVARDMKAMGSYISRNLSYEGCTYDTMEHPLTPEQTEVYDALAKAWQVVLQNLGDALEATGQEADGRLKGNALAQFWGSQQRFFNQILTAMQMPSVVKAVEKDIADGKAIVMQIVNTNQAIQNRRLAAREEGESLEDLDITPRDILMQYLDHSFPVAQYEEYTDEQGSKRMRLVTDSQGNPVVNREALAAKERMMTEVGAIKVPDGPLEIVLDHFGVDQVAEVTGRNRRIVRKPDENGRLRRVEESWGENQCLADIDAFMEDKKRILVFSEAGGTGQSYHADPRHKNTRQRAHYVIQAGWRADVCVQGFGRTHRSNETSKPEYRLVTTNLKGQRRFISTIARRLDQLGALTKGQRQTGGQGLFSAADNLEGGMAKDALMQFYVDLTEGEIAGMPGRELLRMMGLDILDENGNLNQDQDTLRDVPRFLNRLLSLESGVQNRVFEEFDSRLRLRIERAIADGSLDVGMEDFKADRIEVAEEKVVYTDERTKTETRYLGLDVYHRVRPNAFDSVVRGMAARLGSLGFYRNTRSGNVYALMRALFDRTDPYTGAVTASYGQVGQIEGDFEYVPASRIEKGNWEKLTEQEARPLWEEALTKLPEFKKRRLHMITGTVLPIWDRLPKGRNKVYRVKTSEGRQFLGRRLTENEVDPTLRALGAGRAKEELAPADMINRVLEDGATIHLANGWRIMRRKVSGENRLEILGRDLYEYRGDLEGKGVFMERIQYETRFFIPTGETAAQVLGAITKYRPVVSVDMPEAMSRERERAIGKVSEGGLGGGGLEDVEDSLARELDDGIGRSTDLRFVPPGVAESMPEPDNRGFKFNDRLEKEWQASNGVRREGTLAKFLVVWDDFKRKVSREFEHLPRSGENAEIRYRLLEFQKQKGVQSYKTLTVLRAITDGVRRGDLYNLFERAVVFADLQGEYDAKRPLPYEMTREEFTEEKARLDEEVARHPEIGEAVVKRKAVWKALVKAYIDAMEAIGFHVTDRFLDENGDYREDYFHHQVLERVDDIGVYLSTGRKLQTPTRRGWLQKREGYHGKINRNYLEAEFEVMGEMMFDIKKAALIALVQSPKYNVIQECRRQAAHLNDEAIERIIDQEKREYLAKNKRRKKAVSLTEKTLNLMRGRIAWGFGQLGALADSGHLWDGHRHEFRDVVDSLKTWAEVDAEFEEDVRNKTFRYLAALRGQDIEGSMPARTILKNVSERREFVRKKLGSKYKTWEDCIPVGYVPWQPREGNVFYMANSIPERVAEEILEGLLDAANIAPTDIKRIMAVGGKRPSYVIREEIALTLHNLMKPGSNDPFVREIRKIIRAWKARQILAPDRFVKSSLRNLSGDADPLFVGCPKAFRKSKESAEALYRVFWKDAPITGKLKPWFEMGGMETTMPVQDLGEVNQLRVFEGLVEQKGGLATMPEKVWRKYWDTAHLAYGFREAILRYASFLYLWEEMEANNGRPKNFGASIPEEIMALPTIPQRAFVMSNQLLGAYDQVSVVGQWLATYMAFFWRFREVNFRRYIQLFRNAAADGHIAGAGGRTLLNVVKRSPMTALRMAAFLIKASAFWALLQTFNRGFFPDEEDELSEDIRSRPHIILGRNPDGSVRYYSRLGAVGDFLEFFGLDAPQKMVSDWLNGRKSLSQTLKEMGQGAVNALWQQLSWLKMVADFVGGIKTYPDVFKPGKLRDKWQYLFDQIGVGEQYRWAVGLPHRSYSEWLKDLLVYTDDPGQGSYYDILDAKREFEKKLGKYSEFGGSTSPRSNALYNLKLAGRYQDADAMEKYLTEYIMLGGTIQGLETSLRNMHPLYGLNKEERDVFIEHWLDDEGRERLLRALKFYEQVLLAKREGPK